MQFSTFLFWSIFAGIFCATWAARRHVRVRNSVLLLSSYALYFLWDARFLWLLIASTLVSFGLAFLIRKSRHRTLYLTIGIVLHLSVLIWYKYSLFFFGSFLSLDTATAGILLPLGISFYTFQILSYLIGIYREKMEPTRSLLDYALYIAFFPKIIAGPLEQPSAVLSQLREKSVWKTSRFADGVYLVVWGAIQKFCIADNAALITHALFHSPADVPLVTGLLALSLHIYADFSGYSDMAKGIAALLGFELSWNFRMPYVSNNPSEFWKRWHITLSQWFQQNVYIPLGGNRKGEWRTAINLLLTMLLVGLWHGASWAYVLWGLYHGLLLACYRVGAKTWNPEHAFAKFLQRSHLSTAFFFVLTSLGWVLFMSPSMAGIVDVLTVTPVNFFTISFVWIALLWMPIVLMQMFQTRRGDLLAFARLPLGVQLCFYYIAYYIVMYVPPLTPERFIYMQF